jgi:hypothetical protein
MNELVRVAPLTTLLLEGLQLTKDVGTALPLLIENYCGRLTQFAACWLLRTFDSDKPCWVLLVNAMAN